MENCSQYDELITRYLLDELDGPEKEHISAWIYANEEHRLYYEQFKQAWNLASFQRTFETVNIDEEWAESVELISKKQVLPLLFESQPEYYINTEYPSKRNGLKILSRFAVAASLLLVAGLSIYYFNRSPKQEPAIVEQKQPVNLKVEVAKEQTEINNTNNTKTLLLSDGSSVLLYANSELIYDKIFEGNTRELKLKGKAQFKVFKNKNKPFIVHTGDISITVLGTVFTVTSFEKEKQISIKLFEGKVWVKSEASAVNKLRNDIYLVPGQELVYDKIKGTAVVKNFKLFGKIVAVGNKDKDDPTMPENFKGSWFMFNNQTLPEVFDQLENIFNSEIVYSKRDLQKMYFIGKFDKSDSLENILKNMGNLYHLKVTRENNKFLISKQ
jgi:transmembrane sensor